MSNRWRMVVGAGCLMALVACGSTENQVASNPTPSATSPAPTIQSPSAPPMSSLSPTARPSNTKSEVPPSWPIRLDIGGAYPIHAQVLQDNRPDVLEPPDSNYTDAFVWTLRGMPGDGATDTTYLFGHTYRGPTEGVFDNLQNVEVGTPVHLTTSEGVLRYCITTKFPPVPKERLLDPSIGGQWWAIQPLHKRGRTLVFFACFLNDDGSPQDKNVVVLAERC